MSEKSVKVWDPLVRILHWSLVLLFAIAFASEDFMGVHRWVGYLVLGIVATRTVWGVIGTKHARFTDFIYSPASIKKYLIELATFRPSHYLGHNPAGGVMILLLLIAVLGTGVTGILADGKGGLQGMWEEVHEVFANGTVLLIVIHVLGVIVSSLIHKENLVRAMFTGRKSL